MGNKEFGELVKALREHRTYSIGLASYQWTQEKLAQETQLTAEEGQDGLSVKQIGDIEQGRVVCLKPTTHLAPLARAFRLNEAEKTEFYASAGIIYHARKAEIDIKFLEYLLERLTSHALVRTSLWDIVAFNSIHFYFWGYNQYNRYELLQEGRLGANLLRVLFDPAFGVRDYERSYEEWEEHRIRDLRAFRAASFRHITDTRYREIIDGMMTYKKFEKLWRMTEMSSPSSGGVPVEPVVRIYHPDPMLGEMQFVSLQVPREYHGMSINITVYNPLASHEERYRQFATSVKDKIVRFPWQGTTPSE